MFLAPESVHPTARSIPAMHYTSYVPLAVPPRACSYCTNLLDWTRTSLRYYFHTNHVFDMSRHFRHFSKSPPQSSRFWGLFANKLKLSVLHVHFSRFSLRTTYQHFSHFLLISIKNCLCTTPSRSGMSPVAWFINSGQTDLQYHTTAPCKTYYAVVRCQP